MNDLSQRLDVETDDELPPVTAGPRKPRLAIMGEFSAGKSTLSNLLLGARPLPEKVTATRLSPVWITQGPADASPMAVTVDGDELPVDLLNLDLVDVDSTRFVRMSLPSDILRQCDLIDFPGISDPNMDSEVWERMLPEVDMVLWCTHATQAWRQSEAAAWDLVSDEVRARSLLLVTRFDKLTTERDQARVMNRLRAETEGLFAGIHPMRLLQALAAVSSGDDAAWLDSGAAGLAGALHTAFQSMPGTTPSDTPSDFAPEAAPEEPPKPKVVPRRIRPASAGARIRPRA